MPAKSLKRIYVWRGPVRVFHWANAFLILVLIITGYIIGEPPAIQFGGELYQGYWFGTVKFIHFAAAYLILFNFIYRIFFMFFGNRWAHWDQFVPTNRQFIRDIIRVLKIDILHLKGKPYVAIGHNPLAGFSYLFFFFFLILSIITGFGLYADMSTWWLPKLFSWVPALLGEEFAIREIHHILMWAFIIFAFIHIHLVIFHDYVEGSGETSSMIGGFKFIDEERIEEERQKSRKKEAKINESTLEESEN